MYNRIKINLLKFVLFISIVFYSCNKGTSEKTTSETINDIEKVEDTENKVAVKNNIFVCSVTTVKHPRLNIEKTGGFYNGNYYVPEKIHCFVDWYVEVFASEIIEIGEYNEDFKYRFMDKIENDIKTKLYYKDESFRNDIFMKCQLDENRDDLNKNKSKIIKTTVKTFDSYSEASKYLRKVSSMLN